MELFDIAQPRGGRIYAEAKRWHGKAIRVYLFTTAYNASGAATVEAVLAELELTPYEERKGTGVIHTEHDSRVVDDAAAFADLVNDYIADQAVQATELWLQRYHGIPKLMTGVLAEGHACPIKRTLFEAHKDWHALFVDGSSYKFYPKQDNWKSGSDPINRLLPSWARTFVYHFDQGRLPQFVWE